MPANFSTEPNDGGLASTDFKRTLKRINVDRINTKHVLAASSLCGPTVRMSFILTVGPHNKKQT